MTRAESLSLFLDALVEWGCEDNDERAKPRAPVNSGDIEHG
jgi:hypothetical protein